MHQAKSQYQISPFALQKASVQEVSHFSTKILQVEDMELG